MVRKRALQHVRLGLVFVLAASSVLGVWLGFSSSRAQVTSSNANWPNIELQLHSSGLSQPVQITHADDGSGRKETASDHC